MKYRIFLFAFTLLSVTGCVNLRNGVFVENDRIMKIRKVTYDAYFVSNHRYEQSYTQKITFLKETDINNITKYTLYDVITLPVESFDLDDKMYIVADEDVDSTISVIIEAAKTGKIGDGKIFVSPIEKIVRIRTGEQDEEAI